MPLHETLSGYRQTIQYRLFPWLEEDFGPLGERHEQLVTVLGLVRVETFVRLGAAGGGSERGDVFAGLCRVRQERAAEPPARDADRDNPRGPSGR